MHDIYKTLEAVTCHVTRMARAAALTAEANEVIADMPLLLEWKPGVYAVGEVRVHHGQPWRCCQAHDSTGNETWTPGSAPALWAPYHAMSPRWALPWVAPTGAQDAYQPGECMAWTDGQIYKCLAEDTVHAPDTVPEAWLLVGRI